MKWIILLATLFNCATSHCEEIYLGIGETFKLKSRPLSPLKMQKKGILNVKDFGHSIVFTGKKLGQTKINLSGKEYQIQVLPIAQYRSLQSLSQWVKNKRGPAIKIENRKVVLSGRLLLLSDFWDLESHLHQQSQFINRMKIQDSQQNEIRSAMNHRLSINNLPAGQWSFSPNISMRIPTSEKTKLTNYRKILAPYGIEVIVDKQQILLHKSIQIRIHIAHVKKSFLRQWGMNWPTQFSAQVVSGKASRINDFILSLNTLENEGWGQTLATPTLLTEANQWAQFHSGGEFPIQTTTQFSNSVEWKRYGLSLKVRPTTNGVGELRVELDLDISSLDHNQSSAGIPALNRSQLKTQVTMKNPRPFFLSGFIQRNKSQGDQGLPWLRQIPLFSPLFSSGQITDSEYELIFILIPEFHES